MLARVEHLLLASEVGISVGKLWKVVVPSARNLLTLRLWSNLFGNLAGIFR